MQKMDGKSMDVINDNIEKLKKIFPDIFSAGKIDFEALRTNLGEAVEIERERYSFNWNGKQEAKEIALTPSTGTLRPDKESSKNWDETENLYIEGDNLEVLKLLQKSYYNKIKMIYIDPPYNTGKDFVYKDNFRDNIKNYKEITGQLDENGMKCTTNSDQSGRYHSNWLNMMYPRLKLARNLLTDNGVIFISIDDNEIHNLRKLTDEIFGEDNFVDCIVWKKRYGGGAKEKHLVTLQEYIFVYAKNILELGEIFIPLSQENIEKYYQLKDLNYSKRGPYRTHPLEAGKAVDERPKLVFDIIAPDGSVIKPKRQWYWSKERVYAAIEKGEIEFVKTKDGGWTVHSKQYLYDENGKIRQGKAFSIIDDIYSQHGTNEILNIMGNAKIFPYPKPSELLKKLLNIGMESKSEEIILDFFSGSAAMAHATIQLNVDDGGKRKFIMVQLPENCTESSEAFKAGYENICEIGKERIRRAGDKIIEENSDKDLSSLDIGFKCFRLDSSNIKVWDPEYAAENLQMALLDHVDNIKKERTEEDILYELLIKHGLDLITPIMESEVGGKTIYNIGAGALYICLANGIDKSVAEGIIEESKEWESPRVTVIFKDTGFNNNKDKTNVIQTLKVAGITDVKSV